MESIGTMDTELEALRAERRRLEDEVGSSTMRLNELKASLYGTQAALRNSRQDHGSEHLLFALSRETAAITHMIYLLRRSEQEIRKAIEGLEVDLGKLAHVSDLNSRRLVDYENLALEHGLESVTDRHGP